MNDNAPITIRAAKPSDAEICQILRKSGWQDNYAYPEGGITEDVLRNELAKMPPSEDDVEYFVSNLEDEESRGNALVAELSGGRVVGVIFYDCLQNGNGDIGVFVDREYRGQGIGSALLEKLIGQTSNDLEVTIFAQNRSRELYKKYGFKEQGGEGIHQFDSTKFLSVQKLILKRP